MQEDVRMDQAGILRKFIQGVKAMSEGDEERGEDNFGSDFMVGQNEQQHIPVEPLHLIAIPSLSLDPFLVIISTFSSTLPISHPFPAAGSLYPPGGEAGAVTLPSSFSSPFQALHGGLSLSPKTKETSTDPRFLEAHSRQFAAPG